MAATCLRPRVCLMIPKPGPVAGPVVKPTSRAVFLVVRSQLSLIRTASSSFRLRSSFNNHVFEDRSEGIICYRDEDGEIVCEGYDEGPRFQQNSLSPSLLPRDTEIIDLLQQNWIKMVKGSEVYRGESGLLVQEDINCNGGFNTFH